MSIERIYVCPYSHSDWAWIAHRRWHEKRYIRAFELVLDLMDAETGFAWFIDSWHEQFSPIRENRPDLVERMKPHVAAGRFGLGPGTFTNLSPSTTHREALIRNVLYGQRKFRELFGDVPFELGSHIDCGGWFSQMPQLMTKMGFAAMMMCRPAEALDRKHVPRQFRWRSPDGSEIACHRISSYALFAYDPQEESSLRDFLTDEIAKADTHGSGPAAMVCFGWDDDCLPLGEPCWQSDLFAHVAEWNRSETAQITLAAPGLFARDLAGYARSLPVITGGLNPAASGRVTENGHDNICDLRARCSLAVTQAERESMHYGDVFPEQEIEALWEQTLSIHPHATAWLWQRDNEPFILKAKATEQAALALRGRVRRAAAERIGPTGEGRPIVLFNPLPFDRTESCEFYFAVDEAGAMGFRVTDGEGNALTTQFVGDSYRGFGHGDNRDRMRCEWRIRTELTVPACGYATVYLHVDNDAQPASVFELSPRRLDIGPLSVEMPGGVIEGVTHNELGRLLDRLDIVFIETDDGQTNAISNRKATRTGLDDPTPWPPEPQWNNEWQNNGRPVRSSGLEVEEWSLMETGPLGARVFITGAVAGNPTEVELFIHAHGRRIDCDVRSYMVNPVSGYLVAELRPAFDGRPHADVPFGVEPRDLADEPFGPEIVERAHIKPFWGQSWADYSDGDKGVAILSQPGLFGYRVDGGVFQHILLKTIAPGRQAGARWGNDTRTGLGLQRMTFAAVLHAGDWKTAQLYREIETFREPIEGEDALYKLTGDAPDTQRGLAVAPHNVMVSAFFKDRGATMLRIYENQGAAVSARVDLPAAVTSAQICDLLGGPTQDTRTVTVNGNRLEFDLGPWEIVTIRLD
ncbi:hypothetical protein LCGC14_0161940 [marine sediment metagenome]|uniref:Uncharacterized protein n=1 Tax=marine sediment metagenome TaxID=412755 RepID=A0A0F9UYX8_9ZZZZ|nr:hypothetical protein [Phycisphaerae bacterium]